MIRLWWNGLPTWWKNEKRIMTVLKRKRTGKEGKHMNTIFIVGSSSGIGKATARLFAEKGWTVIATMRTPEKKQN